MDISDKVNKLMLKKVKCIECGRVEQRINFELTEIIGDKQNKKYFICKECIEKGR